MTKCSDGLRSRTNSIINESARRSQEGLYTKAKVISKVDVSQLDDEQLSQLEYLKNAKSESRIKNG